MTVRASIQVHFSRGDISHRHRPGSFSTLDIGTGGRTDLNIHFWEPADIDKVIAELLVLRAEMTGGDVHRLTAANPPHDVTDLLGEDSCNAEDSGYICNSQDGHDGPDHVAYGGGGQVCHRWPVTEPAQDETPACRFCRRPIATSDQWCIQRIAPLRCEPAQDETPSAVTA